MRKRQIMPKKGGFYCWKKVCIPNFDFSNSGNTCYFLLKLFVPANAKRYQDINDDGKFRVSHVKVIAAYSYEYCIGGKWSVWKTSETEFQPFHLVRRDGFFYNVGKTVKCKRKFSMKKETCASGIHAFMQRIDAIKY